MSARRQSKAQIPQGPITVTWELAHLPSSQHRAGLAGLVLMVRWLATNRPTDATWTCRLDRVDAVSASLVVDLAGMKVLFDGTYAAALVEQSSKTPWAGQEPKRVDEVEIADKKGKSKTEKRYVYDVVQPRGAFLADPPLDDPPWIKLWRDMVWNVLRGVPATRGSYQSRANGVASHDGDDAFQQLVNGDRSVELPSTYYLGAQAFTAEGVSFKDRGRNQFLLHFWPFAVPIYVPQVMKSDGSREFAGFAFAVPDVADLATFCDEYLNKVLTGREPELNGYRPRAAVVDVAAESGLDVLRRISDALGGAEHAKETGDLLLGVDVIHAEKEGNNVRIRGVARVEPGRGLVDEYRRVRGAYWDSGFRKVRVGNVLSGRAWWRGFDRVFETVSQGQTIGSEYFRHDAKYAFNGGEMMIDDAANEETLEVQIYRAVGQYVSYKLDSKYKLKWESVKDSPGLKNEYNEKREKIGREAFLAVRGRDLVAFKQWFAETLCSAPQRSYIKAPAEEVGARKEARFQRLARAVLDNPEEVRTLTLMALSAHS